MWWVLVATVAIPTLTMLALFDAVVSREYRYARESWEKDGKPRGFRWRAPEHGYFVGGTFSRMRAMNRWFYRDPEWAEASVRKLLRAYRAVSLVQLVVLLSWLAMGALKLAP